MQNETTGQTPRRLRKSQFVLLLSVVGPGIIAANADNDASGIYGYSLAGAQYRYSMLWVLVLSTIALGVAQEICARMGAVTGKGLADLIREEYGVKVTLFAMIALLIANFATTVSEFAGILAAVQLFAGPKARFVVLPLVGSRRMAGGRARLLQAAGTPAARRVVHLSALHRQRVSGASPLAGRAARNRCAQLQGHRANQRIMSSWSSMWSARRSRPGASSTSNPRCATKASRRKSIISPE